MEVIKKVLLFCIAWMLVNVGTAQNQVVDKIQQEARAQMDASNFRKAFESYEKLLAIDPNNAQYNYEMGVCLFKGSFDKSRALPYLEKASDLFNPETTSPELFYYLGKTYHYESNFLFAIAAYNTALNFLAGGKAGDQLKKEIDELIDQCEQGRNKLKEQQYVLLADEDPDDDVYKYFVDGNRFVKITNMGNIINTDYSEYGPIFMGDNSEYLVFTSRKMGTGGELYYDDQYYEDIYVAYLDGNKVLDVTNLNESDLFEYKLKNTSRHDATVSMSNEEDMLFIYYKNHVMEIKKEDGSWTTPVELSEDVANQVNQVTSASISADRTMLLLVSNRSTDTKGGRDIYFSVKKENGDWGPMQNLGAPINTAADESSPYMPNDTTLYFSSKGHSSIGGYDVFVSHKRNGQWTTPEDLNMPINTPFDEINYRISSDKKFAYYSSDRAEGYGRFDIYKITKGFSVEVDEELLAQFEGIPEDSLPAKTFLDEQTLDYINKAGGAAEDLVAQEGGATIEKDEGEVLNELAKDENLTIEKTGKNTIEVTESFADNKPINVSDLNRKALENAIRFNIPDKVTYYDEYANTFIFEETAHFGFNSVMLTEYSKKVIQPIIDFIKDNPNANFTVRLYGHADSKGSPSNNMKVSKRRTLSVKEYLEQQGVEVEIITRSFGESRPAVMNETPETAIYNRRVQVRVYAQNKKAN